MLRQALDAQLRLYPYALAFLGVSLPIFIGVAVHGGAPLRLFGALVGLAVACTAFGAIDRWLKAKSGERDLRLRGRLQLAAAVTWSLALGQCVLFCRHTGPLAEPLLVLCAGAAAGIMFFASPLLPSLLLAGAMAALPPVIALKLEPGGDHAATLTLCGLCLAMALCLALNRHLRGHYRLAVAREELARLREIELMDAEALSRSRSELLETLSREVRTGLKGLAHVLGAGNGDLGRVVTPREQVRSALQATHELLCVLDATLDTELLRTGGAEIPLARVGVAEVVEELAQATRTAAMGKRLECDVQIEAALRAGQGAALTDRERLVQIVSALTSNAIRYTDVGRVSLAARLVDGARLRIEVADTGHGLSADEIALAFRPFKRIDRTCVGVSGAGLGLSLARELASRMQAEIGVDSAPGRGSRFWVDLPFDAGAAPETKMATTTTRSGGCSGLRVLVIAGDSLAAATLKGIVSQLGHGPVVASTLERGCDLARDNGFEVALIDMCADPNNAIERQKQLAQITARTQVIGLVGGNQREAQWLRQAGVGQLIRRPASLTEVARAIAQVIDKRFSLVA